MEILIDIIGAIISIAIVSYVWHKDQVRLKKLKEEDPDFEYIYTNPWGGF
ncbi:MAG: hypothetical protein K6G09_07890 [Treponema sp.]|nr:hypothetical protein [Treponema sp.]